jgi:Fe-S-cluster containining protein
MRPQGAALNTCQQCGACCSAFRVSFYWAEAVQRGLPDSFMEKVHAHLACMAGTNRPTPQCLALQGQVGKQVNCLVYQARPSPCREVQPGDAKCNEARVRHGLDPLVSATQLIGG